MLEKRDITRDTLRQLTALQLAPNQGDLVASNAITIAQVAYEPGGYVWGLWDGDDAVGLFAMIHPHQSPHLAPGDDPDGAYLWRFMIAADKQGHGYGAAAIELIKAQARDWGLPRIVSSVVDAEHSNLGFYEHLGFTRTGRKIEGEWEITLTL